MWMPRGARRRWKTVHDMIVFVIDCETNTANLTRQSTALCSTKRESNGLSFSAANEIIQSEYLCKYVVVQ